MISDHQSSVVVGHLLLWVICCRGSSFAVICCRGSSVFVGHLLSSVICCRGSSVAVICCRGSSVVVICCRRSSVVIGHLLSSVICCPLLNWSTIPFGFFFLKDLTGEVVQIRQQNLRSGITAGGAGLRALHAQSP